MEILQIILLLFLPLAIIKLVNQFKKARFISPIIICYAVGIAISSLPGLHLDKSISMTVSEVSIPVAIPLVLFSTNFMIWLRLAKKTIISFCLVIICALVSAALAVILFYNLSDEYWKISGMLVGVYIGGTPNLMAIGMSLHVSESTLVLVNAADTILGGIYLLFLITVAKRILGKFLPEFRSTGSYMENDLTEDNVWAGFKEMKTNEKIGRLAEISFAFLLAILIVAIAVGISILFTGSMNVAPIMLIITALGIVASFIPRIRNIKGTFRLGQYFILVFSLAIGTTVNLGELFTKSTPIFKYTAFVMFTAVVLHYILAAIFRIDTDTTIITSVAGIFGPAFIVPVAGAIKNREVIIPGLLSGLVGYAVANFLGLFLAYLIMP